MAETPKRPKKVRVPLAFVPPRPGPDFGGIVRRGEPERFGWPGGPFSSRSGIGAGGANPATPSGGSPVGSWPGGPFGLTEGVTSSGAVPASWPGGPFAWPGGPFGWPGGPFGWSGGPFGWPGGPFGWPPRPYWAPGGASGWPGGPFGWPGGPFGWPGGPFSSSSDPNATLAVSPGALIAGLGWHPEMPDARDVQLGCGDGRDQLEALVRRGLNTAGGSKLLKHRLGEYAPRHLLEDKAPPAKVDVRERLPNTDRPLNRRWTVENQGPLNACTAHAVVGLVEYLVRWQLGQSIDLSRMFLYAATRRLLGWTGDPGAYIRTTIRALAVFGAPPEEFWGYDPALLDAQPDAFLFSYAASFKALTYMRLDANQMSGEPPVRDDGQPKPPGADAPRGTLRLLEQALADGYPVAFGFPVYSCIRDNRPEIPAPTIDDRLLGGHAVLAVGYDRARFKGEGGILIRNSWGERWGNYGYGWLPYSYVTRGLACDFWTIFKQSWLEGQRFQ